MCFNMNQQGVLTSGEQHEVEVTQESTEATQGNGDETKDLSDQVSCLGYNFWSFVLNCLGLVIEPLIHLTTSQNFCM